MSISTYAELKTAVANWLHRDDLTSIIPDLIMIGEKRIYRDVRCHDMESSLSSAIASGVLTVPTDFIGFKAVYIDGSPVKPLQTKALDWIYQKYPLRSSDDKPSFIARNGANFEFGPYPDSTYTVKGTYYQRLTAVSSSWNALATRFPDIFLMAALCEAAPFIGKDNRIQLWEAKYIYLVNSINLEERHADLSGSPLAVVAG